MKFLSILTHPITFSYLKRCLNLGLKITPLLYRGFSFAFERLSGNGVTISSVTPLSLTVLFLISYLGFIIA